MSDEGKWEQLVSLTIDYVQAIDSNRWNVGDVARLVKTDYGQQALSKFAGDINMPTSSLYEYRRVADNFVGEDRTRFPTLGWSHFRAAAKLDYDDAIFELEQADANDMRISAFAARLRNVYGKGDNTPRVLATITGYVASIDPVNGTVTLGVDVEDWSALLDEVPVRLQVLDRAPEAVTM